MQTAKDKRHRYQLSCPRLPLAVYREVAAHLRQVSCANAGLFPRARSLQFDYYQSQIGGLWIEFAADAEDSDRQKVDGILAYYSDRFGPWEESNPES